MRSVAAVALCCVLGACATFGGGEPNPYGIYDVVSINGEALPTTEVVEGWCELQTDGAELCSLTLEGVPEPLADTSPFTLGEMRDGCFPYESTDGEGTVWTGSICGEVLTVSSADYTVVLHKRR